MQDDVNVFQHTKINNIILSLSNGNESVLEDALIDLFGSDLNLDDIDLLHLFDVLTQNIDKVIDLVMYNAELMVVLHSLCCSKIQNNVKAFVDAIYVNGSPRELFLIHTSLVNYTDNTNTLLHSLLYLPSILERIPEQRIVKTLEETIKNVEYTMAIVSNSNDRNNDVVIDKILQSFLDVLPCSKETIHIILLIIRNRTINEVLIDKINAICLNCSQLPNIILSFNHQQLLTYAGFELPIPIVLNPSKLHYLLQQSIKHCSLFPQHSIIILQLLMGYRQQDLDVDVISVLHQSITSIQTDDIAQQRNASQLFQMYILSHSSKSIQDLIQKVFADNKYRQIWPYILHVIRGFVSFSIRNQLLPCFDCPSLVFDEISPLITKLLENKEYVSLDKYVVFGIIDELVDVVSFIHFVSNNKQIPLSIKEQVSKLEQIHSNLLKVRTITLNGLTDDDKEQIKKANEICDLTAGNEKMQMDVDGALERNRTRIEFGIFTIENTLKPLKMTLI